MQTITIAGDNLSTDLILYRRDGRRGQDLLAQAYELNPGLAELGPILPIGTKVILPDPVAASTVAPVVQPISLFD